MRVFLRLTLFVRGGMCVRVFFRLFVRGAMCAYVFLFVCLFFRGGIIMRVCKLRKLLKCSVWGTRRHPVKVYYIDTSNR